MYWVMITMSFLGPRDLLSARQVCKLWRRVVYDDRRIYTFLVSTMADCELLNRAFFKSRLVLISNAEPVFEIPNIYAMYISDRSDLNYIPPTVECLGLGSHANAKDEDVESLTKLKYLDISTKNEITERGLRNMKQLEYLYISCLSNVLTDRVLKYMPKLVEINLTCSNSFSAVALSNLKHIKRVVVSKGSKQFFGNTNKYDLVVQGNSCVADRQARLLEHIHRQVDDVLYVFRDSNIFDGDLLPKHIEFI